MRRAVIDRKTTETQILVRLGLEGQGRYRVKTGIRFLDHMLELVARHGAFDLGGRPHAVVDLRLHTRLVGDLQSELIHDFFEGFAIGARANVHVKVLYGRSSHHQVEAIFKAFGRALRVACARDKQLAKMLPSTKGLL